MARPREFDESQVLDAAMETFWAKGFEATSVADLVDATGLNRASLYGGFGTKHDLLLAALNHYETERVAMMLAPMQDGGIQSVIDFFEQFPAVAQHMPDRAALGCFIVNSTVELAALDSQVDEVASRYRITIRTAFENVLQNAVESGEVSGSAEALADQLYLITMGLFVSLRGAPDLSEVKRLVQSVTAQIDSWRV